jgi:hypothetical protein
MNAAVPGPSKLARREGEIADEVRATDLRDRLRAVRPFQAPVSSRLLSLLLIGGDELATGLGAFCELTRPADPDALAALDGERRFDLVLVELTLDLGAQQAWRPLLGQGRSGAREAVLARLAALASVRLLWLTEPLSALSAFAEPWWALAPLFATDPAAAEGIRFLPAAFDPHRFNPLKPRRAASLAGDVPVVAIDLLRPLMYGADRERLAADCARLSAFGPVLGESRWKLRPDGDHLSPDLLERHLGRIAPDEHQALLALARFALVPAGAARQQLESLGAGSLPLIVGEGVEGSSFAVSAAEADGLLRRNAELFWHLERRAHRGYRDAHLHHGYRRRLGDALASLDGEPAALLARRLAPEAETRSANLIVPTMRPWQLPYVHAMFEGQTLPRKQLTLMIHGEPFDLAAHFPAIAADERVRWRFVPDRYGIGTLLNIAIEENEADYWAKIDDDDFYGPDYARDYVILGGYADFAIAGKSNLFTYDEAADAVFSRKDPLFTFAAKDTLAGGSFFCRAAARPLPFDERVCGYADMDFLWRNAEAGQRIVASDRYNFCQIRRRDRASHTWKIRFDDIAGNERVAAGRAFAAACA